MDEDIRQILRQIEKKLKRDPRTKDEIGDKSLRQYLEEKVPDVKIPECM